MLGVFFWFGQDEDGNGGITYPTNYPKPQWLLHSTPNYLSFGLHSNLNYLL